MKQCYLGVILALLFAAAAAGPINSELFKDSRTCAKRCLDNNKFKYTVGSIYKYEYEADSKTSIVGASEDAASIRIKAFVEIEPMSPCDMEMRLKDVSLVDPYQIADPKFSLEEFTRILTKSPLRFSFQDGRIEDLCPHAEDPIWALNIKRGVLSAFQNSMKKLDLDQNIIETDVTGRCETKYMVAKDGSITKTKDMVSCRNRHGVHSAVQSIGYEAKSSIQCLAIMKTIFSCTQRVNKREMILDESVCTEKHILRPFSNGESGAATVNTQTLRFVEKINGKKAQHDEIRVRSDLLFVHQFSERISLHAGSEITKKLTQLCDIIIEDVRPEQPEYFSALIKAMKMADVSTLKDIYKQLKNKRICPTSAEKIMKVFRDAVPMVGTSSSLELIRDFIWQREVIDMEKDMWLASLPFIQNPEKKMLSAIRPLLEDKNVEGKTILMVSSLVSGYCSVNPKCEEVKEFSEIMDVLSRLIGKCTSKGPYEKTLYALRAIGNIGHSKNIVPRLTQCFTRREIPVEIRLAAIDAFRRIPCEAMRVDLLDLFSNIAEDAELRINAYLALMKCPHKNIVMRVKEALRTEKTNQVGSFVWTHLTNLKETYDPHMQELRALLIDEELKTIFNKDNRKFSRNYETSFFLDEINTGGKIDSNVIFSPKSFVPRSANLNMTFDLFGQAINFFEIGTRMEGVEHFLERYFGNTGYFKNPKSPVKSEKYPMKEFDDKYKVDIDAMKGFAFVRMFGNELGFWQFEDPNLQFFKNFDMRKWVKNEKFTFHKNMALMDTDLVIPTILGLPLNLNVAAVASIDLEATGKMNLASLKNIELGGSLKPSGAVKVISAMTVDAFATKAGLRMNSMAHSSSEVKMSFNMKNSKVVESKLEFPKKKMEIITIKSDFHIIKGDMVKEQKMINDNVINKNKCTGETFNKYTGLKLCSSIKFSNASMRRDAPYFPVTGPVMVQIEVHNHDAPEGYMMKTHVHEATKAGFILHTPNSAFKREISLDVNVDKHEQKIEFYTPWGKAVFAGKFLNTKANKLVHGEFLFVKTTGKTYKYATTLKLDFTNKKGEMKWTPKIVFMIPSKEMMVDGTITNTGKQVEADLKAVGFKATPVAFKLSALKNKKEYSCIMTLRDGANEYYLKTKLGMLPKGKAVTYTPEILFKSLGNEVLKFDGSFLYNPNSKIILSAKLDKVFTKIVALNARVIMNSNKKKMKHNVLFNLKAPKVAIDVKGFMELKESKFTSRINANYNIAKWSDKLTISSKFLDESTKSLSRYSGDLSVDSKKDLKNNFVLKGVFGKAEKHIETKLDLEVGNPKKNPEKFIFESTLNYDLKTMEKKINYEMSFKRPTKMVEVGFKLDHVNNMVAKKIENKCELKYGHMKTLTSHILFTMENEFNHEILVNVKKTKETLIFFNNKMTSKKAHHYVNFLKVENHMGNKFELKSVFEKKTEKTYAMEHDLMLPSAKTVKFTTEMTFEKDAGKVYAEINAEGNTLKTAAWNPKMTFNYNMNMHGHKLNLFKCNVELLLTPTEKINGAYTLNFPTDAIVQDILITSTLKTFKKLESKYTNLRLTNNYEETFLLKIDDFFAYEEATKAKFEKGNLLIEYTLNEKIHDWLMDVHFKTSHNNKATEGLFKYKTKQDNMNFLLALDHLPGKIDLKATAEMNFPIYHLMFNGKTMNTFNKFEKTFNSDGEIKLHHPKNTLELTYFAKADTKRVTFDTTFTSPTSKHRSAKLAVDIAMDEAKTSLMAKVDLAYNGKRLYSLTTGYKNKDMTHNFQLAFLLPNGERITTVFNLSLQTKKSIHAEIKLPRNFGGFELNMDGNKECMVKACEYKMHLNTNTHYIRNLVANVVHMDNGFIDVDAKFDGFNKNMEITAKIEGGNWHKKTIMTTLKINGAEKLNLEGKWDFTTLRKFNGKCKVMTKLGKTTDNFVLNVVNDMTRSDKGKTEVSGMLELLNKKYVVELTSTDYKTIKAHLLTPAHNHEATFTMNKLKWNDLDVKLTIKLENTIYELTLLNHHFQEIKFVANLAGFKKFDIFYKGGINDQKKGTFNLKITYGEYFFETESTLNMGTQFELKTNVAFKLIVDFTHPNPKVHTGSGDIKMTHHMDSVFNKINANLVYGKEKINFSSLVKNTGKINMNIRLKTSMKFSATLKAQIKPDMYNTDLSLVFDTKWTGTKKFTYSHSGQKGKHLNINAELFDGKGKQADYTLNAKINMKNAYGLNLEVTTDKMAKKYNFDGELMMNRNGMKGKLYLEAPWAFMAGTPIEITFNKEFMKFATAGKFRMMEYTFDLEYSPKRFTNKIYINWNKQDKASKFNFMINYIDAGKAPTINKKFNFELVHPVRTVAFATKFVKNPNMMDVDIEFSGNAEKGQKLGFSFGKTHNAGYVKLALPTRTFKIAGRLDTDAERKVFSGSFFWNLNKDDSKKIDLTVTLLHKKTNALFDVILKFPSQTKGLRLRSELSWKRGDTLLKSKTEFSLNQDPKNVLTIQAELLKDENNKYTLTLALMHPKSNLDVLTTFRVFELNHKLTFSMDFKHGNKMIHLIAFFDKKTKEISFKLKAHEYTAELFAHYVKERDYEISAKFEQTHRPTLETYINLSPSRKNLKIKTNYDEMHPERYYLIEGNLLTNKMLMIEAFHRDARDKTTDTRMDFTLDAKNILHGKIVWRPQMIGELNQFLYGKMMKNMHTMKVMWTKFYTIMTEETTEVTRALHRALKPELETIEVYMNKEWKEVVTETTHMLRTVSEMFDRDYLYVKTFATHMDKLFAEFETLMMNGFINMKYQLRHGFTNYYNMLLHKMEETKMKFNHVYMESYRKLAYDIEQAKMYVMKKMAELNAKWIEKRNEYLQKLDKLNRATYQYIFEHKYTKAIVMLLNQKWDELVAFMREHKMMKPISDLINYVRMHIKDIHQTRERLMAEIKNHPAAHELFVLGNEFYQQLVWAYKYWNVEMTLRNLDDKVKNYITNTANGIREQIFSLNQMEIITFDLRHGEIEFKFPLVMPKVIVQNQKRFTRFVRMVKTTVNKLNKWHPEYNYTIADLYYALKPSSNPIDWIPPFKAQASIYRDQHITTFDGVHLDFKGACSYVLARDFAENHFTVLAKFANHNQDQRIESVIFHAESEKLELFFDYQVRHNDAKVDLPIQLNALSVNRVGHKMEISSRRGFTITFDPANGAVVMDISGWYFGKVAGLFGTYNNEQYDEMTMPEKRRTTSIEEFATSWAMQGCRSRKNFAQLERKFHRCDHLFLHSMSPFRNCFRQVEPNSFYHMCNTAHIPELHMCKIAKFYVDRCGEKGVPLTMPTECLSCKTKEGDMMKLGKEVEYSEKNRQEQITDSADIVFVVEQRKCNKAIVTDLNRIIQGIEQTLRQKGIQDNRYGLVAFGGDNIRPEYSVTIRSELMASAGLIMNEVRKMEFHDGYSTTDPLKAINLAAKYPFRMATRKTIVLVNCNLFCHEKTVSYSHVLKQLRKQDIALHLLQKYTFEISGNKSPKTTDLFGLDNKKVYTKTESESKAKMFDTIKLPRGDCAELSLVSNGSVFDASKMSHSDMSMFVHRFAQRIADSVEKVDCHVCKCEIDEMGLSKSICTRCPSLIPYQSPLSFEGKLFHGNFEINENLKEQLNMYWQRFSKKNLKGQAKPHMKKGKGKGSRRRR